MNGGRRHPLTKFGVDVNVQILKMGVTQQWLINEIKQAHPELYIDTSILNKVLTGRVNSERIINAIDEALCRVK